MSAATEDLERRFIALIERAEAGRTENLIPFGNAMGPIAWCVGYLAQLKDTIYAHATHEWACGFVASDGRPELNDAEPTTYVHAVGWIGGEVDKSKRTAPCTLLRETVRQWVTIGVGRTRPEYGHSGGIRTVWPEHFGSNTPVDAWKEWAEIEAPDRIKVPLETVREWLGPELLAVIEENLPVYRYCSRVSPPKGYVPPEHAWRDVNAEIVRWGEFGHGFKGLTSASGRDDKRAAVLKAVRKPPKLRESRPLPSEFWRAVFLDQKIDYSIPHDKRLPPDDLLQRPSGFTANFKDRPVLIEEKRYLGSFKVVEANKDDGLRAIRQIVFANGEGTYNSYDTFDEAGEKPVSTRWRSVLSVGEEDLEGMRLYPPESRLSDAEVADLEDGFQRAVEIGNAAPAERLAIEHERRGLREDVLRVTRIGMRAPDHDHGIWKFYDEGARSLRNIQRRLLSMHNRAASYGGSLYDTGDCGEADPKRECMKCGRPGALNADATFGAIALCHVCRKLPRSEWPKPKPIEIKTFFQGFQGFDRGTT